MKLSRWMMAALLVGAMVLTAGSALAAGASDAPLVANGTWTALAAGQQDWYTFKYAGDGSSVMVQMNAENADTAGFAVWTPEEFRQWQAGAAVEPVGRGSANDLYGGALIWTGEFNDAGTYYVVVDAGAANHYALTITGTGVTLPAAAETKPATVPAATAPAATVPAAEAATTSAAAVAPAANSGASASDALTAATGNWASIGTGQKVWYAFTYGGDGSQVVVRMAVDPNNAASFSVWTPEQLANGADEPVGRGSADAALGGDLVWAGSFNQAGTYYVVVTGPAGNSGYALTIQ